jgi:hypothetical protein
MLRLSIDEALDMATKHGQSRRVVPMLGEREAFRSVRPGPGALREAIAHATEDDRKVRLARRARQALGGIA